MKRLCLLLCLFGAAAQGSAQAWPRGYDGYYETLIPLTAGLDQQQRIRLHFDLLLPYLQSADSSHLSKAQRAERQRNLAVLQSYRDAGVFPTNEHIAKTNPVFIDEHDVFCAVGYLIKASGHEAEARAVAATQNLAYVREIKSAAFDAWVAASGLTREECGMIQPAYACTSYEVCPQGSPKSSLVVRAYVHEADGTKVQINAISAEALNNAQGILLYKDDPRPRRFQMTPMPRDWFFASPMYYGSELALTASYSSSAPLSGTALVQGLYLMEMAFGGAYGGYLRAPADRMLSIACDSRVSYLDADMVYYVGCSTIIPAAGCAHDQQWRCDLQLERPWSEVASVTIEGTDNSGQLDKSSGSCSMHLVKSDGSYADPGVEAGADKVRFGLARYLRPALTYNGSDPSFCDQPQGLKVEPLPDRGCAAQLTGLKVSPVPLAARGQGRVYVELKGCVSKVEMKLFSAAGVQVAAWSQSQPIPGWSNSPLPDLDLSNGHYTLAVSALGDGGADTGYARIVVLR